MRGFQPTTPRKLQSSLFPKGYNSWEFRQRVKDEGEETTNAKCVKRIPKEGDLLSLNPKTKPGITPTVLRPSQDTPLDADTSETVKATGHMLVNSDKLCILMNSAYSEHLTNYPECKPDFYFPETKSSHVGIGPIVNVHCKNCSFELGQMPLFKRVDLDQSNLSRGHAEQNVRLAVWHILHNSTYEATCDIAWMFDVQTITEQGLKLIVAKLQGPLMDLGKETLMENIGKLKDLIEVMNIPDIPIAIDSAYNNPPKGRSFQANGTQSTTVATELLTEKKLVLSLVSYSQICTCRKTDESGPCTSSCPANILPGSNIGMHEGNASLECINSIEDSGLPIGKAVMDGSHQLRKICPEHIIQNSCAVHNTRSLKRGIYSATTSIKDSSIKSQISEEITKRCKQELTMGREKFSDDSKFLSHMGEVQGGIIDCVQGNHSSCKNMLSCQAIKGRPQKDWSFNKEDITKLQQAVDKRVWNILCNKALSISRRIHVTWYP